ncbi:MAG TPA: hypothetical protein PKC39_15235 [Ferruginibacter sp.]|nr:hypothetical protein [Ferruginibacter sp.]HMP22312.1 hypothetical protein [Ferruginibacter sp.]
MKRFFGAIFLTQLQPCFTPAMAQSSEQQQLGLPGDNLNLYAVLKLFRESPTLEGFEKSLNDESLKINNLDLNNDDQIDYITVDDNVEGAVHNITLKVAVSEKEVQNVAVIAVQKDEKGNVTLQMVGDEDLYGKDYIIEPNYEDTQTPNPGYAGNTATANNSEVKVQTTTPAQVATWPVVTYIYMPAYNPWYSPWHWGYYPGYWRPWRPFYWHYYYGYHYHWNYYYYGHFRPCPTYRIHGWHHSYYHAGYRRTSVHVQINVRQGRYKQTYSRPQMATAGAASFKRDNPKAPSVNTRLPAFDKQGRPVISRPQTADNTNRPAISKPVNKPGTKPVTRPVQPSTKPVNRPTNRPVTKPLQPTTKPVTRPVSKPLQPAARPVAKPLKKGI